MVRTAFFRVHPSGFVWGVLGFLVTLSAPWVPLAFAQSDQTAVKVAAATIETATHPLDPALKLAQDCLQHSQTHIRDYTAILTKRCRVNGELPTHQYAIVKIRNRRLERDRLVTPMSVYLKFLKPDAIKGREIIWVEGRNDGRLVAHDTGLKSLITLNLDPNGSIAMRGQRYPITEIGMDKLLIQMIGKGNRDRAHGECQVDMKRGAKINDRSCVLVQIVHPVKRSHFDFHRAQIFFDDELQLPIRYASWSWPTEPGHEPPLEEEYTYTKVRINVGLTDLDFDPENAEYNF